MLTCVQPTEAAEYLNVVKNEEETTVLHEAVDEQKSLEFTEILLNAGAEMHTNANSGADGKRRNGSGNGLWHEGIGLLQLPNF